MDIIITQAGGGGPPLWLWPVEISQEPFFLAPFDEDDTSPCPQRYFNFLLGENKQNANVLKNINGTMYLMLNTYVQCSALVDTKYTEGFLA
jgi:hypothetical protein